MLSSLPKTALVLGHSGEHVAVESVEVVMVGHIVGDHLCINNVALLLLARLVQSLNPQQHTVSYNRLPTNNSEGVVGYSIKFNALILRST